MLDHLLARDGIDFRRAGQRVDHRALDVLEVHVFSLHPVAGVFHAAAGDERVVREKVVGARLPHDVGPQAQQAAVAGHRREDVGLQHGADLVVHVVVHPLGMDHALALAEDDVAFHIDFQRGFLTLQALARTDWVRTCS